MWEGERERKRETENKIRCGGEENLIQILLEIYSLVDDKSKSVQGNCINENCKSENFNCKKFKALLQIFLQYLKEWKK